MVYFVVKMTVVFLMLQYVLCEKYVSEIKERSTTNKEYKIKHNDKSTVRFQPSRFEDTSRDCIGLELTDGDRENIIQLLNDLRGKVAGGKERRGSEGPQPQAKNMRAMIYDTRLEDLAKTWVSLCTSYPPKNYTYMDGYESIYRIFEHEMRNTPFNITSSLLNRYERVEHMNGQDALTYFNGYNSITGLDASPYATLVRAAIYGVGCAQAHSTNPSYGPSHWFYICNLGSGFFSDQTLYDEGEPCMDLREDCCDRGLVRPHCWMTD